MHHDAIIVGGSFAGLAAATYIARGRRSVVVLDTGRPRNRFAEHSHGVLAQDGTPPLDIVAKARAQVALYPTVTFIDAAAKAATRTDDGFVVTLADGTSITGRRLILAFGISDALPAIPGLAERWGNSVIHCPYCHGYEFSDRQLGVLNMHPHSQRQAQLIAEWGPTTFFLNGAELPEEALAPLRQRGVSIEAAPVVALHGPGNRLERVELADGRSIGLDALYIGAPVHLNSDIAAQLGCEMEQGTVGPFIRTDAMKATNVPGVYAIGDISRAMHNATAAMADGVMAGTAVHASLIF